MAQSQGWQGGVGCWQEALVPCHMKISSLLACPQNKQSKTPPQGRGCNVFCELLAEITLSFLQYPTGYAGQLYSVRDGTKQVRWESLGIISEAGYYTGCSIIVITTSLVYNEN